MSNMSPTTKERMIIHMAHACHMRNLNQIDELTQVIYDMYGWIDTWSAEDYEWIKSIAECIIQSKYDR